MKTVAVAGAGGRLGRVVAKAFLNNGYRVIGITRSGKLPKELLGAEARSADAMKQKELVRAAAGAEIIFNGLNPIYTEWTECCTAMAKNVVAAAETHGATHLFPGNVYSFGSPMPARLAEDTRVTPSSRKGNIRREMESIFEAASRERGVQTIILRAGDFFGGPGTGSWFDQAITSKISKGIFTYPGNPDIIHEWAYLPDLAEAFVKLADQRDKLASFENFHFSGHAITGQQMKEAAERILGRDLKMGGVPWWLVRIGGYLVPMWRELVEMSYLWHEPHQLVSSRLEEVIGPIPYTPLDNAIESAMADLGISTRGKSRQISAAPAVA